ncbi:hypothetical protein FPN187_contig00095-0003 [Flavobacterium psychrophilum]|nr:conserved membrane hypothetical protein [Flavobacterium psychrophilum]GEJ33036.1 hypothetical protein FPN185_contig00066-0003 [Flavobacterium psychrophilum]GEJ35196.1 hypothetical protein FPN181_contig00029-0003 [Flavobacterium psychrophilum]GEJ39986.1 hypothetical protein FPN186_contig00032-0003 [Flavobacterium psychrophilum]GEJ40633.1 hypothetical protein FPN187_contig00095-0003 [Flavobacterium psychrophilum]
MLSVSPDISIFNSADKKYIIANERIGNNVLVGKQIIDIIDLIKSGNNSQIIDLLKIKYSPFLSDEKLISIIDELINNEILIDANIENIPKKGFQKSHIKFKINILREDTINNFTYLLSKLFNKSMFFCTFIFAFFNTVTLLYVIKNNSLSYANLRFNSEFLYFIPLLLFDAFFHELGHMSALKKFKLRHGNIGFGFYLFAPTLFADVNNSWRLDMKQKIIVNLGGVYFNLIFINILFILFYFTQNSNLLILLILLIFRILFNLNPFLKTDGYWVLSDFTKVYNLRTKSKNILNEMFFNIFKKAKINFTFKQYLLSVYALLSYLFILLYVIILFNSYTILYFPIFFFKQIIYLKNLSISFLDISKMVVATVFYAIIINQIFIFIKALKNAIIKKN